MQQNGTFNLKKHFNIPEPTPTTFLLKELQKPLTEPTTMRNKAIIQKRLIQWNKNHNYVQNATNHTQPYTSPKNKGGYVRIVIITD